MQDIKVIRSETLSSGYESRYIIIAADTGAVLDDAQGYGYRSPQKAHAAWAYKTQDKKKRKEKDRKEAAIRRWMKEHKEFVDMMDITAFEIIKGSWGPSKKFNTVLVRKMLDENGLKTEFTAAELLKTWEKTKNI